MGSRYLVGMGKIAVLGLLVGLAIVSEAKASDPIPECPAHVLRSQNGGVPGHLAVNNDEVAQWKHTTPNRFQARAHVEGRITRIYPDRNGHDHFSIDIGRGETLEVIYNQHFGHGPATRVGMHVEACGDYITSTAQSPGPNGQIYPPSPDGAIIHWVHFAPRRSGHHSGYLVLDGVLTGQGQGQAGYYDQGERF